MPQEVVFRIVNRSGESKGIQTSSCGGEAEHIRLQLQRCDYRLFFSEQQPCTAPCGSPCPSCPFCAPQFFVLGPNETVDVKWHGSIYELQSGTPCSSGRLYQCSMEGPPSAGEWIAYVYLGDASGKFFDVEAHFILPFKVSPAVIEIPLK